MINQITAEESPSILDQATFEERNQNLWNGRIQQLIDEINADINSLNFSTLNATSTTSVLIGNGSKTFVIQTAKSWTGGMWGVAADAAAPATNNVLFQCVSYNSGTGSLVVNVPVGGVTGSGTFSNWIVTWSPPGGVTLPALNSAIQNQTAIAFTTSGTGSAYIANPTQALTAYTSARLYLKLHAAPTGSPTMNWSGLGVRNFKYFDSSGTKQFVTSIQAPINYECDIVSDGTDLVLKNPLPPAQSYVQPFRQTVISGPVGGDAATCTISNATPAVVTHTAHGKEANTPIVFTTTGALPTGLSLLTQYYVSATGLTANTYQVSATAGGASINTSSAGSGTHTVTYGLINNANGTPLLGGALGGTSVVTSNINATTPLRVSYAGGYNASGQVDLVGTSTANLTFSSLSTNGTMYGYLTYSAGGNTTSTGTLAPVVQQQGIPSTVNGQYTYNIKEAKMYLGNGSVASVVNAVHVATFTVAAGVVSAITWRPFQQTILDYSESQPITIPAANTEVTFSHGIGFTPSDYKVSLRCVTAELGYAVGDESDFTTFIDGDGARIVGTWCNASLIGFLAHSTTPFVKNRSAAGGAVITNANWRLIFRAWR